MAANDTSMSVLGQFYDAVYEASKDQGKKYGKAAKPDFIPGVFSDQLAEGLTMIGAAAGASLIGQQAQGNSIQNYALEKTTIGKLNLNQLLPVGLDAIFPSQTYNIGSPKGDRVTDTAIGGTGTTTMEAELKFEYKNPNDLFLDPRAAIGSAVDAYRDSLAKIRKAKLIAGTGAYLQEAANYQILKNDGVPSDVAAAIANSRVRTPQVGEEVVSIKDRVPLENLPERVAGNNRAVPRVPDAVAGQKIDSVMGTSMAMFLGLTDKDEREEFASHIKTNVLKEVTTNYTGRVVGSSANGFFDLFSQSDETTGKNLLAGMRQSDMFNPAMGGKSVGDTLQASMMDVLAKHATDTSLSPRLRGNLTQMYNKIQDETQSFELFQGLGKSVGKGVFVAPGGNEIKPKDLGPVVQLGVRNLATGVQAKGDPKLASNLMSASNRIGAFDGKLTPAEQLAYMAERWNTLPPMNKWLTPAMFVIGDGAGFMGLINGLGGMTGTGPLMATNPRGGINFNNAFGEDNAKLFTLDSSDGKDKSALLKWAYGGLDGKKTEFKTDKFGNTVFQTDKAGNRIKDAAGKDVPVLVAKEDLSGAVPSWGKVSFTVSADANSMQKAAYFAYVFHPVNVVKGALNGSLFHHASWIAAGHGKLFENKEFGRVFKSKEFGNIISKPRAPGNKAKIDALVKHYDARFAATGNKDYLRAKNVVRIKEFMHNPRYMKIVKGWETLNKYIGLPAQLQRKAMELAKRAALKAATWAATKLGMKVALEAVMAAATWGTSLLVSTTYEILNFISFGLLDKVVFGTLKLALETVVGLIIGTIAGLLTLGALLFVLAQIIMVGVIGGGGSWAPGDYMPVLEASAEAPPDGDGSEDIIDLKGANGIDVSHWQGTIDWAKVKGDKVEFAIIKASEGTGFVDDHFKKNWNASKSAGLVRSAYHFFRPELDGAAQAEHFLKIVASAGGTEDFPISIDVEQPCNMQGTVCVPYSVNKTQSTNNLKKMIDRIKEKTGKVPMIYTSDVMWRLMTTEPSWGGDTYPLWVAAYNNTGPSTLPKGWSDWTVWQYSSNGKINGISGDVDLDKWNKNGSDDPTDPGGGGGTIGYPPDGPGTGSTYSGTCQEIFAKVKAESLFSGTKASSAILSTPNLGPDAWCSAFSETTITCGYTKITDWCTRCANSATRLFRHELTHIAQHGSEFCSELVGDNGGGYAFKAPDLFGNDSLYTATQIGAALSTKYSISIDTLKGACVGNSSAMSQVSSKGITLSKYNTTYACGNDTCYYKRQVSCIP